MDSELKLNSNKAPTKEVLDVTVDKSKERAVFSLLSEKQRTAGTFRIERSPLLNQVKMFLPKLEQANKAIEQELKDDPSVLQKYDIEHTEETSGPLIEMDLAVYEDDSDSDDIAVLDSTDDSSDSDLSINCPVDESNLKMPNNQKQKKCNLVQEIQQFED